MIIAVGNTKGGVGKTTVALNIAIGRRLDGRDVWLVDGDPQRTAESANAVRADSGQSPALACSWYSDGKLLRAQVQQQAEKYDDVVIDVGGRDNGTLRAALIVADVVIVPFTPRSFDVWALPDMAALVEDARTVRDGLHAYAVLNMADTNPTSVDNNEAAAVARDMEELDYLETPLARRKPYADAAGAGRSVLEQTPINYKARGETRELLTAIEAIDHQINIKREA